MPRSRRPRPDVVIPAQDGLPPIHVHYADLPPEDITTVRGFRVTTMTRTLIDLSGRLPAEEVARLIGDAIAKRLVSREQLVNAAIERTDIGSIEEFREALWLYLQQC
jgi:hypothetical protein